MVEQVEPNYFLFRPNKEDMDRKTIITTTTATTPTTVLAVPHAGRSTR